MTRQVRTNNFKIIVNAVLTVRCGLHKRVQKDTFGRIYLEKEDKNA